MAPSWGKNGEKMMLKDGDAIDMMGMKMKDHAKKEGDAKPIGDKDAGNTNNVTNTKTGGGVPTPKTGQPISPEPGKDTNNVNKTKTSGGAPK